MYAFGICNFCGRYAETDPATQEDTSQLLTDWAADHKACQLFIEAPEGWPTRVSGVHTNGHMMVTFRDRNLCAADAEVWPCFAYAQEAAHCPGNAIGLPLPDASVKHA